MEDGRGGGAPAVAISKWLPLSLDIPVYCTTTTVSYRRKAEEKKARGDNGDNNDFDGLEDLEDENDLVGLSVDVSADDHELGEATEEVRGMSAAPTETHEEAEDRANVVVSGGTTTTTTASAAERQRSAVVVVGKEASDDKTTKCGKCCIL